MPATGYILFGGIDGFGEVAGSLLFFAIFVVVPLCLIAWFCYFMLSLPLRRQGRARLFIDLLAGILERGQPVEATLVDIAASRDRTPGVRFHLMVAHIETGLRLEEALQKVPRLLPPRMSAMLRVGEKLGDLRKVLPACRQSLNDAQSNVRGGANYLIVVAFVFTPLSMYLCGFLMVFIFPRFQEMLGGMVNTVPVWFRLVSQHGRWLMLGQGLIFLTVMASAFVYIGGPRLIRWMQFRSVPVVDWLAWQVPWKRKRMQRDFSAMFAVLLDGGVSEMEALGLAGECTANEIFRRRSAQAQAALAQGGKLTDVVQWLDDRGEFRWRLTNAVHAHGGFLAALKGWHESLDAKAFQEEQAAAHFVTSSMVLANGLVVGIIAAGVFGALVAIIEEGVLW